MWLFKSLLLELMSWIIGRLATSRAQSGSTRPDIANVQRTLRKSRSSGA